MKYQFIFLQILPNNPIENCRDRLFILLHLSSQVISFI